MASCAGSRRWRRPSGWRGFGVPVSRALSRDLQAGAAALGADSEARRIFGSGTGTAVTEGDNFVQTDLAGDPGRRSASAAAPNSSRAAWRAWCPTRSSQIGGSLPLEALRSCRAAGGAAGRRELRRLPRLCRAAADGRRDGARRLERPAAPSGAGADRLRRHLRPGGDRFEGRRGRLQPVDGPALRRARDGARTPACCSARRPPTARRSARW